MNTNLTFLGTGNAMVTKCYNTCFLINHKEETVLVDAGGGNGIFNQMESVGADYTKIHHMFITHGHTDHILGAIWIVRKIATMMNAGQYEGEFHIFCHDIAAEMLTTFCNMTLVKKFVKLIGDRILIHVVEDGDSQEMAGMKFTFFDIFSTKAKQFGFQAVLKEEHKIITCLGDEPYNEKCENYVKGSDYLLCEAFCLYQDREIFKPYEKHHSTAKDAGELAQKLQIKNLVLYHTEDKTLATRKTAYTAEAKAVFEGNVYVPDDLDVIPIA